MGRVWWAVVFLLVLGACGGREVEPDAQPPVGFDNQTQHSDAELWVIWHAAQESLSIQVDMNPLQRSEENAAEDLRPGDPRALSVLPHHLLVASQPDVQSNVLYAATGVMRTDPTGLIACPAPCNVRYAAAYSLYGKSKTAFAASWESSGEQNFSLILQYEFENHILNSLGYDMRWR